MLSPAPQHGTPSASGSYFLLFVIVCIFSVHRTFRWLEIIFPSTIISQRIHFARHSCKTELLLMSLALSITSEPEVIQLIDWRYQHHFRYLETWWHTLLAVGNTLRGDSRVSVWRHVIASWLSESGGGTKFCWPVGRQGVCDRSRCWTTFDNCKWFVSKNRTRGQCIYCCCSGQTVRCCPIST